MNEDFCFGTDLFVYIVVSSFSFFHIQSRKPWILPKMLLTLHRMQVILYYRFMQNKLNFIGFHLNATSQIPCRIHILFCNSYVILELVVEKILLHTFLIKKKHVNLFKRSIEKIID